MEKEAKTAAMINLFMGVVMGIALSITGQILNGEYSLLPLIQKFIMSLLVGYLIGSLLPAMKIGKRVAHTIGCKDGIMEYLVSTFVLSVLMIGSITVCMVFIDAGAQTPAVLKTLLPTFLAVGVPLVELTNGSIVRLARKLAD